MKTLIIQKKRENLVFPSSLYRCTRGIYHTKQKGEAEDKGRREKVGTKYLNN
jgi:hypothetical protein